MMATPIMTDEAQTQGELQAVERHMKAHDATLTTLSAQTGDEASRQQLAQVSALREKFAPAYAGFVKLIAEGSKDEALMKYMFSVRAAQNT